MPKPLLFLAALTLAACTEGGGTEPRLDGGSNYYGSCNSASDCDLDLTCYVVAWEPGADGAMCSDECEVDGDCLRGGACYELVGDPMVGQRICYSRCEFTDDCPARFTCADTLDEDGEPTGDAICLPCASSGCP